MRQFLRLWLVLSVTLVAATVSISVFWFRHINLTYEYFAHLIVVPVCQALILTCATNRSGLASFGRIARETATHPLVIPVLVMDAGLLISGWLLRGHFLWGLGGTMSLHVTWIGTKAMAAALFLFAAISGQRGNSRGSSGMLDRPGRDRLALLAFAAWVFVLGLNAFWPWLRDVPALLLGGRPLIVQWLVTYGILFPASLLFALRAADILRPRSGLAAVHLEAATAAALAGALVLVSSAFVRPYPTELPLSVARFCASLAATFLLVSGIVAAVPAGRRSSP